RWWCVELARGRQTCFAESDVHQIVGSNLRFLLGLCSSADASESGAAHDIIRIYGRGGLPFVKQLIAESMLGLMQNLLPESTDHGEQVMLCTRCLLVGVLRSAGGRRVRPMGLIKDLVRRFELLWRADDDPRRSYAEAEQDLKTPSFPRFVRRALLESLQLA
ncbi:unnamed protein product, partial [Symbiodinium sp. CCMP2456]